jgi:azurin
VAPTAAAGAANLEISAKGDALEFNKTKLSAKAGAAVVLTFNNVSAINQHNWVIVQAGAKDAVATRGTTAGPANNWLQPGDPQVIASTPLLDPGKKAEVRFTAPPAGRYQFVCTFPGHNFTMFGDFEVTP